MARSTVSLGKRRLNEVVRRYQTSYIVAPPASVAESGLVLPQVYANAGYVVLRLSGPTGDDKGDNATTSSGPGDAKPPALNVERLGE